MVAWNGRMGRAEQCPLIVATVCVITRSAEYLQQRAQSSDIRDGNPHSSRNPMSCHMTSTKNDNKKFFNFEKFKNLIIRYIDRCRADLIAGRARPGRHLRLGRPVIAAWMADRRCPRHRLRMSPHPSHHSLPSPPACSMSSWPLSQAGLDIWCLLGLYNKEGRAGGGGGAGLLAALS